MNNLILFQFTIIVNLCIIYFHFIHNYFFNEQPIGRNYIVYEIKSDRFSLIW